MIQPPYHRNDEHDIPAHAGADNVDALREQTSRRSVDSESSVEPSIPWFLEKPRQTDELEVADYSLIAKMEESQNRAPVYDEEKPGQLIPPPQAPEWLASLPPGDRMNGRDFSRQAGGRSGFKINTLAISIAMLPVLAVGTATYFLGKQVIDERIHQLEQAQPSTPDSPVQSERRRLDRLLAVLLMGSGCTALLAGVLAVVGANRLLKVAMAAASTDIERQDRENKDRRSQALTVAATRMRVASETDRILNIMVETVREIIPCDRAVVYQFDRNSHAIVAAESVARGCAATLGSTIDTPYFIERPLEPYDNDVRTIENIYEAGLSAPDVAFFKALGVKAIMSVPLFVNGHPYGFLVAQECSFPVPRVWLQSEKDAMTQLSLQASFALDSARLLSDCTALQSQLDRDRDRAEIYRQIAAILRESQADVGGAFLPEALPDVESVAAVADRLQEAADSSRSMVAKAQKAELQLHDASLTVREGHDRVNQTVDLMAEIQEIVTDSTFKLKNLGQSARKISQVMTQINELAVEMRHQAINASIASGQLRDRDRGAIAALAETVLSFTEQLKTATIDMKPLVAAIEADIHSVGDAMEVGAEHTIVGTELIKETRHKLNQLSSASTNLSGLISKMAEVGPAQSYAIAHASQTMQQAIELTTATLSKSTELSKLFDKLEATMQEL
ncbi:GAF domain-containing protein [Altericista sp. CCNU0014]|uniref:methyl-accepting chemotaxis protein n=1 Tax=Altericista sp. CCNU0014 TaxID=3082949 RepID=UPI00384F9D28